MINCTLEHDQVEDENTGLYTHGQIITDPIYGQFLCNCCLTNATKLKLQHNVKILLVEMMRVTGKEIAENVTRLTKVIPTSHVTAKCEQLQNIIHRLWKVVKRVEEREKRRERRMVGKRTILVLM
jgi:hypothetical protein